MSRLEALLLHDLHDTVRDCGVWAPSACLAALDISPCKVQPVVRPVGAQQQCCLLAPPSPSPRFSPRARRARRPTHLPTCAAQGVYDLAADLGIVQHGQLADGNHGEAGWWCAHLAVSLPQDVGQGVTCVVAGLVAHPPVPFTHPCSVRVSAVGWPQAGSLSPPGLHPPPGLTPTLSRANGHAPPPPLPPPPALRFQPDPREMEAGGLKHV